MNTEGKHIAPGKALEMGFVNEVVEPGKEVEAAKAWVASTDVTGAPWDEKGFKVPGGAGLMHPRKPCRRRPLALRSCRR